MDDYSENIETKGLHLSLENEEDYLPLSGIQHFAFCERQWGLIHVETQWVENLRTAEGRILHKAADNPYFSETRDNVKVIRSVPLVSRALGLYGVADVIEIHKGFNTDGIDTTKYVIIEYKRGKPKPDNRDEVQLCAQAFCLEEMLGIIVECGFMFYGETRHRHKVEFSDDLRYKVRSLALKMHNYFNNGFTPLAVKGKRCKNCSMIDVCVPEIGDSKKKAGKYMSNIFETLIREERIGDLT